MVKKNPTITVLVPTFNRGLFIKECLDSLFAQTLPASQILVVNNGSTDDTKEVLAPYMDRIDYMETPQSGKPAAINAGLRKVTGEYLWIFDDDDVALPNALELLTRPLEEHPEHGFSFSTFFYTKSRPDHALGEVMHELQIPDLEKKGFLVALLEGNFLGGAALFARTSCYGAVGDFDTSLIRSQDYDMAVRVAHRFTGIRVVPATFHYRQHAEARGSTRDRFASGLKNLKWLEYDQIIFRKIYRDFSLSDYLKPGLELGPHKRQAFLQRLAMLANKLLYEEAMRDLKEIALLDDPRPFSDDEKAIIRRMIDTSFYAAGNLLDRPEFLKHIRRLAASSKGMARVRDEFARAIVRRCVQKPGLKRVVGTVGRLVYLHA